MTSVQQKTIKRIRDTATVTRTIYGLKIQTARYAKHVPTYLPHETLNEHYGVLAGDYPSVCPDLGYFMIGTNGKTLGTNPVGEPEMVYRDRDIRDNGLFRPCPLAMRRLHDDLTDAQRECYRLRNITTGPDGEQYFTYWAMPLDETDSSTKMWLNHPTADGGTVTTPFIPQASNLTPTAKETNINQEIPVFGDFGTTTDIVKIVMQPWQVDEAIKAKLIISGTDNFEANEWAVLTGVDKRITSTIGGKSATYTEVQAAQVSAYLPMTYTMGTFAGKGMGIAVTIGNDEPLAITPASANRG